MLRAVIITRFKGPRDCPGMSKRLKYNHISLAIGLGRMLCYSRVSNFWVAMAMDSSLGTFLFPNRWRTGRFIGSG